MDANFFGNEYTLRLLKRTLTTKHIAHAYLFHGEKGLGKKTLARWFAQGLLCASNNAPCGECSSCVKVGKGIHPDFCEIDPQGKQSIPIDSVRSLIQKAFVLPNESVRRVFLINDAHFLQPPAANSLLKLLEEPPKNVVVMLTCENRGELLKTISSRCVPIELYPVSKKECFNVLDQALTEVDRETLDTAVNLSCGNIGSALFYADKKQSQRILQCSAKMETALACRKEFEFLAALSLLEGNTELIRPVLRCFSDRLRLALAERSKGEFTSALSRSKTEHCLMNMAEIVLNTYCLISKNVNTRLTLSCFCAELFRC